MRYLINLLEKNNINYIYNSLRYIGTEEFIQLRSICINHIYNDKKFNINKILNYNNYTANVIQIYDNTHVQLMYNSTYICIYGKMICKENNSKYIYKTGDVGFIDNHNLYQTIHNPFNLNTIFLQIENYKTKNFYYFN